MSCMSITEKLMNKALEPTLQMGLYAFRRRRLNGIGIPIIKLRRPSGLLRFIMGFLHPWDGVFLVNRGPSLLADIAVLSDAGNTFLSNLKACVHLSNFVCCAFLWFGTTIVLAWFSPNNGSLTHWVRKMVATLHTVFSNWFSLNENALYLDSDFTGFLS